MASLLISKVNAIKVIQVGESKLSVENKSEDGSKIGGSRKIGFVGDGINKTIDLGKGKKKHTLKLFVFDKSDTDALFKIFYEERYCTIVDKFKGKIKVYIDSIDVTDSDKHANRTVYDISCTVQDLEKNPNANFSVKLASLATGMQNEVSPNATALASRVSSFESIVDTNTDALVFVDSALDMVRSGVDSVLSVKSKAFGAYATLKSKIDTSKRLYESLKNLKDFPDQFIALVSNITEDDIITTSSTKNSNSVTSSVLSMGNVQKTEITVIVQPEIRGKPLSQVDVSKISQIEVEILEKELLASQLINKIKTIKDIKSILAGGFNSQEDFEMTVNATIERLNYIGYTQDAISDKVYIIKSFANSKTYKDIIEVELKTKQPLTRFVFDRYGDLDNYYQMEALNNFKDNDLVSGKIKAFA